MCIPHIQSLFFNEGWDNVAFRNISYGCLIETLVQTSRVSSVVVVVVGGGVEVVSISVCRRGGQTSHAWVAVTRTARVEMTRSMVVTGQDCLLRQGKDLR